MALTPKQEAFCLAVVEGKNQTEAYKAVYGVGKQNPATINRHAKKLMDNDKIVARIAELRQPAIDKAGLTFERHLLNLEELKQLAAAAGQYSAAIAAETNRGKAAGLYTEKIKHSGNLDVNLNILADDINI